MKVKVTSKQNDFTPYTVTFCITTPDEGVRFHDKIAIKLAGGGSHDFIGNIYERNHGEVAQDYEGEI